MSTQIVYDKQKELTNCTFVKTVLMIAVVVYHCLVFWGGNWFIGEVKNEASVLKLIAEWLNSFHIYGFTLVSGYLFYFLKCEKGKYASFLPFALNKAKRLLVPYLFVAVIWVVPITQCFYRYTAGEIVSKYVLGTAPSQLWFLLMLFGVFMLFYPLTNFFEKHTIAGGLVVCVCYGFGMVGRMVFPNVVQIFTACQYIPLFWMGFKIRQTGSVWLRKVHWLVWIVLDIVLFTILKTAVLLDGMLATLFREGLAFVVHMVGALMAFAVLQALAERLLWQKSRVFSCLTNYAMPVYLFHQQIVYLCIYWLNGVLNPYIHASLNFICAMSVSLAISALLMKFKPTKILIGEK